MYKENSNSGIITWKYPFLLGGNAIIINVLIVMIIHLIVLINIIQQNFLINDAYKPVGAAPTTSSFSA